MKRKQHLLVIRFSSLGDVAMAVPVVHQLATEYPDVRITMLSRPEARPLFEDLAPNVNFMGADIRTEYHGVKGLNTLYRRLVAKQFTHVADLHNVLRSEYLRLRFNIGHFRVEHINKHRRVRRQLMAWRNKVVQPLPTTFDAYRAVFSRLGFPVATPAFASLFPPEGGNLNLLPASVGPKRSWEQWIGVAPLADHAGKTYPMEKMEQVLQRLTARYPKARIFLFSHDSRSEQLFSQWAAQMPQCADATRCLENMQQELILMSHLDVMLSMDSPAMHLASLTATPVVSVWGATHPYAGFAGWGQQPENVLGADIDCRPCSLRGHKPCRRGDYACLNGIAVDTIVEKVNQILLTPKND